MRRNVCLTLLTPVFILLLTTFCLFVMLGCYSTCSVGYELSLRSNNRKQERVSVKEEETGNTFLLQQLFIIANIII